MSLPGSGFWNVPWPEEYVVMLQACRIQETPRKHMAGCKQKPVGASSGRKDCGITQEAPVGFTHCGLMTQRLRQMGGRPYRGVPGLL